MQTPLARPALFLFAAAALAAPATGQTTTIDGGVITRNLDISSGELVINGPAEYRPDADIPTGTRPFLLVNDSAVATVNGPVTGLENAGLLFTANDGGTLTVNDLVAPDDHQLFTSSGGFTAVFSNVTARQDLPDTLYRPLIFVDGPNDLPTSLRIVDSTIEAASRPFGTSNLGSIGLDVSSGLAPTVEVVNSTISDVRLTARDLTATFTGTDIGSIILTGGIGSSLTYAGGSIAVDADVDQGSAGSAAFTSSSFGEIALVDGASVRGPRAFFAGGGNNARFADVAFTGLSGSAVTLDLFTNFSGVDGFGNATFESGTFLSPADTATIELNGETRAVVRGGTYAAGNDAGLFTLANDASLTLIGDLSTFELDGAMLDATEVAAGEALVTAPTGTLSGILDNGDRFDIRFEQDSGNVIRLSQTGIGPGPTPNPVPTPTAAAAGLLMGAGLLRRRRRG